MKANIKKAVDLMIKHHDSIDKALITVRMARELAREAEDIKAVLIQEDIEAELIKRKR